jgi:hypothetical protein
MRNTPTSTSPEYHERIETVAAVKFRQCLWVEWMKEATKGLDDDDKVITVTHRTSFGQYLVEIRPVV